MANPNDTRRRFAPIPIETTFQSIRKPAQQAQPVCVGPQPELTPEPSPRSASPAIPEPQQRHGRFHPQLIETSRRSRRAGDPGPATRPTDKTDITPYTNHIYAAKPRHRRKRGDAPEDESIRHMPPTRRETEDEGVKEYLLELAAKDAARQIEEAALAAFPNSRAREGGVAHFYFRESSGSDKSAEDAHQHQGQSRARRKSSNLGLNWWHKHMQEHAEHLTQNHHGEASPRVDEDTPMTTDSDLDEMDLTIPPNPLWTTANRVAPEQRRDSLAELQSMRDALTPLANFNRPIDGFCAAGQLLSVPGAAKLDSISGGGSFPAADNGRLVPDAGCGRPFGTFGLQPEDPKLRLMRQAASPPMLGKDLTFRKCPSPKQTKLETDHPFYGQNGSRERNRNAPGQIGLWNGHRCGSVSNNTCDMSANGRYAMIVTPQPPGSPCDPIASDVLSEEPSPTFQSSGSSDWPGSMWSSGRNGQVQVATRLAGVDERLRQEKSKAERHEKILQEFDDAFVTQVYNYLSLGYPAMARSFDEELSKISRVSIEELSRDDESRMAMGHMLEMNPEEITEDARCPRWKALRLYIREWAEQHPNLDNLDPLAWGVRERRGSWAV